MDYISTIARRFRRIRAMFDKSAWLLIAPALAVLLLLEPALGRTLLTWSAFGVAIAGVSVIISRIIFPHFDLSDLYERTVQRDSLPCALLGAAVVVFVGMVMLSLVVWAKA